MCGIAGTIRYNGTEDKNQRRHNLDKMAQRIRYRGPDFTGFYLDMHSNVGLVHNRLSIQDLSDAGHQPMVSDNGSVVVVFNGEIYNKLELIEKIEHKTKLKFTPKGHSDTEVLIKLIDVFGCIQSAKMLVGMFAICVYSKINKSFTLIRDRAGEKPLFFYNRNNLFLFASEITSIAAHDESRLEINHNSVEEYLRRNFISSPNTIYNEVVSLLPGHYCVVSTENFSSTIDQNRYWELRVDKTSVNFSYQEALYELERRVFDSVNSQCIGDVPVGCFLSGGVDSSLVASVMQQCSNTKIKTFTVGFKQPEYDESKYAEQVAKFIGSDHTTFQFNKKDILDAVDSMGYCYDQPFADASQVPTFLLSKFTKQKVTVSLTGDGGDELFLGYSRYLQYSFVNKLRRLVSPQCAKYMLNSGYFNRLSKLAEFLVSNIKPFKKRFGKQSFDSKLNKLFNALSSRSDFEYYSKLLDYWQDTDVILCNHRAANNLNFLEENESELDFVEKMAFWDFHGYLSSDILVKVDRASMFHSLETRAPLLDKDLIQFAFNLPIKFKCNKNKGKVILCDLLSKFVSKNLFDRPKMGFGPPIASWLKNECRPLLEDLLNQRKLAQHGLFDHKIVNQLKSEHITGKKNNQYQLWSLLIFQNWFEKNHN